MNCNNDISQYKGTTTFTFDGVTYNKVKVTKSWNRIGIRYFVRSTREVKYFNIYEVPVGEYSHTELYNAIANCLIQFGEFAGNITVLEEGKDPAESGYNNFPLKSYTKFNNRYSFSGNGMNEKSVNYIDIVAVPNGIQTILPFTLPMPFVHNKNADYPSRNTQDDRFSNIIQIFNSGYFFNMIWMNPYFFYHKVIDCQYPNNFIGFACNYNTSILFSDLNTGSPNSYRDIMFPLPPGIYTEYGYLIAMLTTYVNSQATGHTEPLRFIIYEENNYIKIRRSGYDYKWLIPRSSINIESIAGYKIRDFSTTYLSSINTFTLDLSDVREKYVNYNNLNNIIMNNYNSNLCLHNNKFMCYYNINSEYIRYDNNKIKYI